MRPDVDWRRLAAPFAFLLAVTIAVVLVRAGLEHGSGAATTPRPSTVASRPTKPFWTVRAGDTFQVISSKTGVPVARIERLNPKVSSTTLFIGQRIRLR